MKTRPGPFVARYRSRKFRRTWTSAASGEPKAAVAMKQPPPPDPEPPSLGGGGGADPESPPLGGDAVAAIRKTVPSRATTKISPASSSPNDEMLNEVSSRTVCVPELAT